MGGGGLAAKLAILWIPQALPLKQNATAATLVPQKKMHTPQIASRKD